MNKNLKNEYPEMPENYHTVVQDTLQSLEDRKETTVKKSPFRVAVLAAAIIVMFAMTGFAANTVYEKFIIKENDKVTLELGEESGTESDEESPEYVKLNFGYMPDYLIPYDAPYKYSTEITEDGDVLSGLTFQLFRSELAEDLEILYVGSVTECMFGDNMGAVMKIDTGIESDGDGYDKQFLINFDDFGFVLRCYVSEKISEDEMVKIANGLSLEETDKEHAFIPDTYIPTVDNGGIIAPSD